ncbi:endolytic transglycosylase MltG [Paenibacillus sp. P96]|uniref:Endolytic murein transglycosylase n=1 Tax=Paenibacillus zeirhizosphaerae TaxID=2987519 RepID=A0ABT9FKL0_9BACL|nr:endolytic transglycosylase MltG [Paenibacillus sp. P96]MDP4095229.1 endolytic transglycosylase MltG [Paenibacillus sp. P96]
MKRKARTGVLLLLILLLLVAGAVFYFRQMMQPVQSQAETVAFTVEQGMGSSQIADLLEKKGLIRNSTVFKAYLKFTEQGRGFQAGNYEAQPGATFKELIAKLSSGDVVPEEMIRFTVPEGYTVLQIADRLQQEGIVDKDEFLKLANDPVQFNMPLLEYTPEDKSLRYKLEGYLFPETYELPKDSTVKDIMTAMLEQTQKELDSIPDLQQKLEERQETVHELLTVASLVEREVVVDQERPIVAGIIYNRLEKGQKLEIDATVQYMLDKQKERLLFKDLRVDSPYNTYTNEGLPAGPIASPSLGSIQAVLEPAETDYFFYVTKKDGSREHLFAKTYQEHLNNIEKSQSVTQ